MSSPDNVGLPFFLFRFGRFREADVVVRESISEPVSEPARVATPPDDEHLLVQVQSGDREALGILFVRYSRSVLSVGRRILRDRAEAEDLVHDVFLFVLDKSMLFNPHKGSARAWLARVAYHRALDRRKYLMRRYFYDVAAPDEFVPGIEDLWGERGAEGVEFFYWQSFLERALDTLTAEQRTTLELHFFHGLTINEISKKTGKSPVNVRHYYYRGLESLRNQTTANRLAKREQP